MSDLHGQNLAFMVYSIATIDGNVYGPYTFDMIQGWIRESGVNRETRMLRGDIPQWTTAGAFPEFLWDAQPSVACVEVQANVQQPQSPKTDASMGGLIPVNNSFGNSSRVNTPASGDPARSYANRSHKPMSTIGGAPDRLVGSLTRGSQVRLVVTGYFVNEKKHWSWLNEELNFMPAWAAVFVGAVTLASVLLGLIYFRRWWPTTFGVALCIFWLLKAFLSLTNLNGQNIHDALVVTDDLVLVLNRNQLIGAEAKCRGLDHHPRSTVKFSKLGLNDTFGLKRGLLVVFEGGATYKLLQSRSHIDTLHFKHNVVSVTAALDILRTLPLSEA